MTRQFEGNVKEIVDHLVDYAAEDCGTRARPALLLNAARLITSQAAEIERLREAAAEFDVYYAYLAECEATLTTPGAAQ